MLLFELIQVSIGRRKILSRIPSESEWNQIFKDCCNQAITGLTFIGIQRLPPKQWPSKSILFQWIALVEQIKLRNKLLNNRCLELQQMFADGGFRTCILKGQGNALMYNEPLCRQSGDIDIWVVPNFSCSNLKIKPVIEFLKTKCDMGRSTIAYHHVDFPLWEDVEIEVHWRPSWRSSIHYNLRLQKWFVDQSESQFSHIDEKTEFHVPTWEFNVIYLLQHMFLHIFQEGLGLRQIVDYYYLLISDKRGELENVRKELKYLGLWKFAEAVMYVLREIFLMDTQYMIATIDEERGKFLLDEILKSGNFGQYDKRNALLHQQRGFRRSMARVSRQLRFIYDYPHETLCAPFQVYHVIWRKLQLWRWE